jgi:hypothetical protein
MVAALESAWAAIQARHPELPDVVIVLGAGSGNGQRLTLGHFAAMRWRAPDPYTPDQSADNDDPERGQDDDKGAVQGEPQRRPVQRWAEVFVGGEGLARGPAEVLATLLQRPRTP